MRRTSTTVPQAGCGFYVQLVHALSKDGTTVPAACAV